MKLERLLAGFGVVGAVLAYLPSCSAEGVTRESAEAVADDGACAERKNAKYSGVSLNIGLNFVSRSAKVNVSDDYFDKRPLFSGENFNNTRFLNKKLRNPGLHIGLDYDFVASNGLLMGLEIFADCMLGSRKVTDTCNRPYKRKVTGTAFEHSYKTEFRSGRFVPGVAVRLGTHFDFFDACLYATGGLYFPNDKYLVKNTSAEVVEPSIGDGSQKKKSTNYFFGLGLKKLLPTKFFGHNLGLVVEAKKLCGKKVTWTNTSTAKRETTTTEIRARSDGWLVSVSAVINFKS